MGCWLYVCNLCVLLVLFAVCMLFVFCYIAFTLRLFIIDTLWVYLFRFTFTFVLFALGLCFVNFVCVSCDFAFFVCLIVVAFVTSA